MDGGGGTPRTPGSTPVLRLHSRCSIAKLGEGEILFVGQTSFAAGQWVGVQLDAAQGKNNGTVQGKRYFDAHEGHGVFVRPSQVHIPQQEEEEEEDSEQEMPPPPVPVARRVASPVKRTAAAAAPPRPALGTTSRPRSSLAPPGAPRASSPLKPSAPGSRVSSSLSSNTPLRRAGSSAASSTSGVYRSAAANAVASRTTTPITPAAARLQRTNSTAGGASKPPVAGATRAVRPGMTIPGRAPDPASARAGLRPVPRTRPSMAPPSTNAGNASPVRPGSSTAAVPRIGAAGPSARLAAAAARAAPSPRTPAARLAGSSSTTRPVGSSSTVLAHARVQSNDSASQPYNEEEEELMSLSLEEASLSELGPPDSASSSAGEVSDEEHSPSTRRAPLPKARVDHMSLSGSSGNLARAHGAAEFGALQREVEELRARVRVGDKKKEEDRERLKELERVKSEAEGFLAIKPKLLAKQQELQQEIRDLHKIEKDWEAEREKFELEQRELSDQLEMAILDKEVAEERYETARTELEEERETAAILQAENEVLIAEREAGGFVPPPGETSLGGGAGDETGEEKAQPSYIQLERHNERYREALMRLRDTLADYEVESKQKIAQLEKELKPLSDLQARFDEQSEKLTTLELHNEQLQEDLENALTTEEEVSEYADRVMALSERVEELNTIIEDLEALKEISDEMEENHIENEKGMQEEMDLKDMQARELRARNEALEANIADYEGTFTQFRELVLNLQNDLETVRAEQAQERGSGVDGQGQALASQSQAMLNLNMKLQSSALKSQAKTIELELGRLEAQQAISHLEMCRPYLPPAYFEADAYAVGSLLFFHRVAHKAELIKTVVEGNHDIAGALASIVPEQLIGVCEMRHSLAHFVAQARQIASVLHLAPVPTFIKAGRMYREHAPIEKRIDSFIEALRREELKEAECGREVQRFVKELAEFSFALDHETDSDLAAKEVGSIMLFDLDLDTLNAALGFTKQTLAALYNDEDVEWDLGERSLETDAFEPLQQLINNIKATKVPARKLLRRLSNLYANDEAVKMEAIIALPSLGHLSSQLVTFAKQLSQSTAAYVAEVRSSKTPFAMSKWVDFVSEALQEALDKTDANMWSTPLSSTEHLAATVSGLLTAVTEQENVMKITGSEPWLARVEQIKAEATHNAEAERHIAKLTEDTRDLYRQIKARDSAMQEAGIKIERLQKQLDKSKEQAHDVGAIRATLQDAQRAAKDYRAANESLQGELETLERANDVLKQQAVQQTAASAGAGAAQAGQASDDAAALGAATGGLTLGSSASLEASYLIEQLEALRGVLAIVRAENCYLKGAPLLAQLEALPSIHVAPKRDAVRDAADDVKHTSGVPAPRKAARNDVGAIARESKALYAELLQMAATPRLVSLASPPVSAAAADEKAPSAHRKTWQRLADKPASQLFAQEQERTRVRERIAQLAQAARAADHKRRVPLAPTTRFQTTSAKLAASIPTLPLLV